MINVLDHGEVELVECLATDQMVLRAMLISTGKDNNKRDPLDTTHDPLGYDTSAHFDSMENVIKRNQGRINYLMREHHGTPFEHNVFIFRVKAPIFVLREWHRHRIGWSYNEQSGRYMELRDKWYIPSEVRTRVGKPGHYTYEVIWGDTESDFRKFLGEQCAESYRLYKSALEANVAPEQARLFLHVNHYSSMYATCNARSLMHFLTLRNSPTAQWEIQQYAQALETHLEVNMPVTYAAYVENGRVAP